MNKSVLSPIEEVVEKHLKATFSPFSDIHLIAGVSGGPDSMAMLHIFRKLGVNVTVVHINYRKRGGESEKDEEMVEQISHQWNFDCHTIRVDPVEAEGENFQQWAREVRYRIFTELQKEYGADGIAVAHHRNDQIETILQKLFRGAGLESWSGMSRWKDPLFRPLLDTGRDEIMKYIREYAIPYRTDRSNLENEFARNLLRNEWLNKLQRYFPGWSQNILRLPGQADTFRDALCFIGERIVDDRDRIDLASFTDLSLNLQKALILFLIKKRDPAVEVSAGALDRIEELPLLQTGKMIQLTEHYSLMRDREWLKIVFDNKGYSGSIELKKDSLKERPFSFDGLVFSLKDFKDPNYTEALYLDSDKIKWPVSLRRWEAGDLFHPFGMKGRQKVSDHLTNRKISASVKQKARVVESFEEKICAVIFPPSENRNPPGTISECVKCSEKTTLCLIIQRK